MGAVSTRIGIPHLFVRNMSDQNRSNVYKTHLQLRYPTLCGEQRYDIARCV